MEAYGSDKVLPCHWAIPCRRVTSSTLSLSATAATVTACSRAPTSNVHWQPELPVGAAELRLCAPNLTRRVTPAATDSEMRTNLKADPAMSAVELLAWLPIVARHKAHAVNSLARGCHRAESKGPGAQRASRCDCIK